MKNSTSLTWTAAAVLFFSIISCSKDTDQPQGSEDNSRVVELTSEKAITEAL